MAGATSYDSARFAPKYAFKKTQDKYYRSKLGLPQFVWIEFLDVHRISKLGFRGLYRNAPRSFDIVGSFDCAKWTVLLHVAKAGFPDDSNLFKTWVVPPQNRKKAFRCIGIKVDAVMNAKKAYVLLKDFRMWEVL